MAFPEIIERAMKEYDPSEIAKYVLELARAFNKYYSSVKIVEEKAGMEARVALVKAVTVVLKEGLRLIGVVAPEEM